MTYSSNKAVNAMVPVGTIITPSGGDGEPQVSTRYDSSNVDVLGVITNPSGHHSVSLAFPWDLRPGLRPGCLLRISEIQDYASANGTTVATLVAKTGIQSVDANTYIITEAAVPA